MTNQNDRSAHGTRLVVEPARVAIFRIVISVLVLCPCVMLSVVFILMSLGKEW